MDLEPCRAILSGAVQIVDLDHARQHLWDLARKLYPNDGTNQKAWIKAHQHRLLDNGKIEKLVVSLRSFVSKNPEVIEKIRTEADYFERNAKRMRCPKFRRQHLFVRSGRHRSRMQNRYRLPPQTVRNVLDGPGSQRYHRSAVLPSQ